MADDARSGDRRGEALNDADTIFALSSGAPPAGIAVVRISGTRAGDALNQLSRCDLPVARLTTVRRLFSDEGTLLDRALVLWMPGPATATGEDVAELHLHGGRAVVAAVLRALGRIDGLRHAEAGEFTRRAFAHGRIDLAEAEALGDLLRAETEWQRRSAVVQLDGGLARMIDVWQRQLLGMSAQLEAAIDFSDEDDVGEADLAAIRDDAARLAAAITTELANPPAERLHDGIRIVVAGAPNAGKSSLINALAGREAAIASPYAGTTRDVIEVPLDLDGIPVILTDTAGLRDDAADPVELIGIERARARIAGADLVIALDDAFEAVAPQIRVRAKCDLDRPSEGELGVSAVTGEGIAVLRTAIVSAARDLLPRPDRAALNARHRQCLSDVVDRLSETHDDPLLLAESLRLARTALDRVTGAADTEAMLDALFGRFCIGK